jgi:putative polyhydroxyalkanoate system protein
MSDIDIEREHKLGREEARKRLNEMEEKLKERYGVKLAWRGDGADVKGTGVTGTIAIADAKVSINLKLGLLVKPLSSKIREAMERQLDKALG